MSLVEKINEDLKKAMLGKEPKEKIEALRAIKSAFLLAKTEAGGTGEISSDVELKIIQKLVKQRKDSAAEYAAQNRADLVEKEQKEAEVISHYLPAQMSEAELEAALKEIITEVGASSAKEMGKVIGAANKKLAGKADGKAIADKVKQLLS